jgi:hypothetical protein
MKISSNPGRQADRSADRRLGAFHDWAPDQVRCLSGAAEPRQPGHHGAMTYQTEDLADHYASRRFQLWAFTVSHGQLLLCSPKGDGGPTRVDVLFKPVRRMDLPTVMNGVRIEAVVKGRFRLSGTDWEGEVLAGTVASAEDDLDFSDPSPLYLGGVGA